MSLKKRINRKVKSAQKARRAGRNKAADRKTKRAQELRQKNAAKSSRRKKSHLGRSKQR